MSDREHQFNDPSIDHNIYLIKKVRNIRNACYLLIALTIISITYSLYIEVYLVALLWTAPLISAAIALLIVTRLTWVNFSTHCYSLALYFAASISAFSNSDFNGIEWFIILPAISTMLGGLVCGRIWTLISIASIIGLYFLHRFNLELSQLVPQQYHLSQTLLQLFILLALITTSANTLIKEHHRAENRILYFLKELGDEINARTAAEEKANQANYVKSQFLAAMSHELRTPLNSIIGFTNRILKNQSDNLNLRQLDALNIIRGNSAHLLKHVNNLLDLSKIESGKMILNIQECDLLPLIENTATTFSEQLQSKNLHLCINVEEKIKVRADHHKLNQILNNLISNAVKYTPKGEIEIDAHMASNEEGFVEITVKDTGIGIPEDKLNDVFREFNTINPKNLAETESTGLGLCLTAKLVELQKGWIELESAVNKGSEFKVFLPLVA